jgi:hypothetical protein
LVPDNPKLAFLQAGRHVSHPAWKFLVWWGGDRHPYWPNEGTGDAQPSRRRWLTGGALALNSWRIASDDSQQEFIGAIWVQNNLPHIDGNEAQKKAPKILPRILSAEGSRQLQLHNAIMRDTNSARRMGVSAINPTRIILRYPAYRPPGGISMAVAKEAH